MSIIPIVYIIVCHQNIYNSPIYKCSCLENNDTMLLLILIEVLQDSDHRWSIELFQLDMVERWLHTSIMRLLCGRVCLFREHKRFSRFLITFAIIFLLESMMNL